MSAPKFNQAYRRDIVVGLTAAILGALVGILFDWGLEQTGEPSWSLLLTVLVAGSLSIVSRCYDLWPTPAADAFESGRDLATLKKAALVSLAVIVTIAAYYAAGTSPRDNDYLTLLLPASLIAVFLGFAPSVIAIAAITALADILFPTNGPLPLSPWENIAGYLVFAGIGSLIGLSIAAAHVIDSTNARHRA